MTPCVFKESLCDALPPSKKKKLERLVLSFCFVSFVFNVTVFVCNVLKQSLILQTKPNRFFFFHRNLIFISKKHLVLYVERFGYEFAAMFVTFVCIFYFALQICINLTRNTFLVPREKKFEFILETTMYECSIFWINLIARINLVLNSVLFWLVVMPGRLR